MRCPVCRALTQGATPCPRCRADLSLLVELDASRQAVLAQATRAIQEGAYAQALALASQAAEWRADETSYRLQAVAALLSRDFGKAWQVYRQWQSLAGSK